MAEIPNANKYAEPTNEELNLRFDQRLIDLILNAKTAAQARDVLSRRANAKKNNNLREGVEAAFKLREADIRALAIAAQQKPAEKGHNRPRYRDNNKRDQMLDHRPKGKPHKGKPKGEAPEEPRRGRPRHSRRDKIAAFAGFKRQPGVIFSCAGEPSAKPEPRLGAGRARGYMSLGEAQLRYPTADQQ